MAQGAAQHDPRTPDMSNVINEICQSFGLEAPTMPYTIENFKRDIARKYLRELTPQERLEGLSLKDRLVGLSSKDVEALLKEIRRQGLREGK